MVHLPLKPQGLEVEEGRAGCECCYSSIGEEGKRTACFVSFDLYL